MQRFTILLAVLSVLAFANTGCRQAANDHGHDHSEEPKTAQISVWTDRYEVFAEHRAPVAGEAITFITHVTDLHTLEPRREGMVKFVLRQGATVAEHPQAAPTRPGIYLPGIIFPKQGEWHLTLLVPTDGTNEVVELGTVKVYADQHAADHAEMPDAPEGVSFLKEQQWKILSKTEPVTKHRLVERVHLVAFVRAKPGSVATVLMPLSGQLVAPADQTLPQQGQRVEAGQLLGLLKPNFSEAATKVAEAEAEFITAEAVLAQAEAAFVRTKKLAAEQAKSPRELQEAELAYQTAKARHAAATGLSATFKQAGSLTSPDAPLLMEVRAPIAGVLNSVQAGPGETVSANQLVFTVLNPESVWIEARIPETSVARLSAAKEALLELPRKAGQFISIGSQGLGQLVSLGLEVDARTRTVPLVYEMKNPEGLLRVGQSVNLHVETASAQDTLAVPAAAIVEEDGRPIVFVQLAGETFEKRDLTVGIQDGNRIQVVAGLAGGERVVTKGAYSVRLASVSSAIPAHGHVH